MAKAKLTTLTQSWINSKTLKSKNIKTSGDPLISSGRHMQTIYISTEASKLLWQNRIETGSTLSSTVDALILTHLGKK